MAEKPFTIVVGVVPDQPADVLRTAADFADRFGAKLVCITVDSASLVASGLEGAWVAAPLDPAINEDIRVDVERQLTGQIDTAIGDRGVEWSCNAVLGSPSHEIAALADRVDADLIIVGTREPGLRGTLHELVNGSVAAQLAHHQHRPVMVVPLSPDAITTRSRRR